MAKCTVTGGAGFIGSHIADGLHRQGHEVVVLDDFSTGSMDNLGQLEGKIRVVRGSITDMAAVEDATEGADFIFHEAALVSVAESVKDPERTHLVNVKGSQNVLDAALKNGAKKVVLASSAAIYGASPPPLSESAGKDPMSPYGKSKLDMELLASRYSEEQGLGTLSLRYFNVYGPRQSSGSEYSGVISRFMDALLMGKRPVIYGDGGQTRDFIYVSDVVRSNIMAMESSACKGEGINIATGKPVSVNELLETIAELMEKDADADSLEEREGDIKHSYADVSKAKELLGFEAEYSLEKGLEKTISWRKGTF